MAQHGDPRDPKIDAVDWVERIPFAETRNYVERVMENLAVYRARFDARHTCDVETRSALAWQQGKPAPRRFCRFSHRCGESDHVRERSAAVPYAFL